MGAITSTVRFPGESTAYRTARDELLAAEVELRRTIEAVAAKRRTLPLGGAIPQDYEFGEADTRTRLSELFEGGKNTLIVYSFMYGPAMKEACPACTSILDALDGEVPHIAQRVNLVVVAKSPIERIQSHARERGWRNLRLMSSAANSYNHDYHAEDDKGSQLPMLNVFVKRDGRVHHASGTELLYVPPEPGQNGRHVDMIWPLWNLFDYTPEGRGENWYPQLKY